jgi:hypothetical protein
MEERSREEGETSMDMFISTALLLLFAGVCFLPSLILYWMGSRRQTCYHPEFLAYRKVIRRAHPELSDKQIVVRYLQEDFLSELAQQTKEEEEEA